MEQQGLRMSNPRGLIYHILVCLNTIAVFFYRTTLGISHMFILICRLQEDFAFSGHTLEISADETCV